jgi:hypothetical protein
MASDQVAQLSAALVARAGGYLRNPVRQANVTCSVCTAPCPGYAVCSSCHRHRLAGLPLADAVAPLTYAVGGRQSGYVMRGYKAQSPVLEHRQVVLLLSFLACSAHLSCCTVVAGTPVTHWATVPSLPPKPGQGEHPLRKLVDGLVPASEVTLTAALNVTSPRDFKPGHFNVADQLTPDSHVLLFDDTWASGGHAQSAALAVRTAGAGHVSVVVISRWLNEDYGDNAKFLSGLPDYDPRICPWTGAACP